MNTIIVSTRTSYLKQLYLLLISASIFFTNGVLIKTLGRLTNDLDNLSFTLGQDNLIAFISLCHITMLIGGIASRVYKCSNNILIGYILVAIGLFITLQPDRHLIGIITCIVGSGLIIPNTYIYISHQHTINNPARAICLLGFLAISNISFAIGLLTGNLLIHYSITLELLLLSLITLFSLLLLIMVNDNSLSITLIKQALMRIHHQIKYLIVLGVLIVGSIGLLSYLLSFPWLLHWVLVAAIIAAFIYVIRFTIQSQSEQRVRNMIILCLFFLAASYWIINTIVTYCLIIYLPLEQIFKVVYVDTFSLTTMAATLEAIGMTIVLLHLMLLIYLCTKFYRKAIRFINLIGIAFSSTLVIVIIFNILSHTAIILSTTQHQLIVVSLLMIMIIAKALIIPSIIILIGQLIPRNQEGLFISFFLTVLGLSIIIAQQFLNSVDWSIALIHNHPFYSYYQLGLVILILSTATLILFFGLLKPIWNTAKILNVSAESSTF